MKEMSLQRTFQKANFRLWGLFFYSIDFLSAFTPLNAIMVTMLKTAKTKLTDMIWGKRTTWKCVYLTDYQSSDALTKRWSFEARSEEEARALVQWELQNIKKGCVSCAGVSGKRTIDEVDGHLNTESWFWIKEFDDIVEKLPDAFRLYLDTDDKASSH